MPTGMHYGAHPKLFEFAKQLRFPLTKAEEHLWDRLKSKQLGYKFRRQHPIAWFIADFYCHPAKLIIEIDGGYHQIPEQFEYDEARTHELVEKGLKVIRFTNDRVLENIDGVVEEIKKSIAGSHPLAP